MEPITAMLAGGVCVVAFLIGAIIMLVAYVEMRSANDRD